MNVIIRTDASIAIGTGHVYRCMALASELSVMGANTSFICRESPGHLCEWIERHGFPVYRIHANGDDALASEAILQGLDRPADCLIVDHYTLNASWEKVQRPFVKKIVVIDDLANRAHDCDLLLDQNLFPNPEERYQSLVPEKCRLLLGPQFALLRPEFREARKRLARKNAGVKRIFVFFGGVDATNETAKALSAIKLLNLKGINIDIVVGKNNPNKDKIKLLCKSMQKVAFHCQVENMADLMANADLAIGAVGNVTWERCFMELPSITITVAENQVRVAEAAHAAGIIVNLGWHETVNDERLAEAIRQSIEDVSLLERMRECSIEIMGGNATLRIGLAAEAIIGGDR
ncbi:UDP-2,4-diacetamido-2,4,6-trideoxy-beta-L-altropyranose hydrolase [Paenibacillus sp. N4]|uniref:UDP-2,4-diacetamido-2,4, 6-trideoxy-beta-L-altropyranose hydrolase n=1 Tax=Paenibacillus vietnamensis TaxID=2590547 RepID=UPI001CD10FBA|nr:UDP-2,4-diacetamido-2,4,6-trideoxy-beta-L-altropyranose hydrolase [Paenibacillus vietnamensis]MCA0754949.1 UDP-2,4-diacetamido-2,4,6-trideoxy-beta-L-altropyranose hydrolase [Paenibacillus vietnamensis]